MKELKERKQIAIYIDYSIRIPNFKNTYQKFKDSLFKDNSGISYDDIIENDVRLFWQIEMKRPDVESFYIKQDVSKIDDYSLLGNFQPYFFNQQHLEKFLEEYSYNIYTDCEITSKEDINFINICQSQLFDVVLIDKFHTVRKISNTCHFISTARLYPRNIVFLGPNQIMNHDKFYGVWNPAENKEQINSEKSKKFFNWLQELEKKYNEERS